MLRTALNNQNRSTLLHAEGGHKLHAIRVAYAKDAPPRWLYRADVSAGVSLRIRGDIGQGRARSLQEHAAQSGTESMAGKRSSQGNVGRGPGHNGRAAARRVPRGLLNPTGNSGGRQQRRFEVDPRWACGRRRHLVATAVIDLEDAGKRPFEGEDKAEIGAAHGITGERGDGGASGKGLRIRAELQEQSGVRGQTLQLRAPGAIVRGAIQGDCAYDMRQISARRVEEPRR